MDEYIQINHVGTVNGKRGISADTDLRLTTLFGLSEVYFLRFQEHIETTLAKRKIEQVLKQIKPLTAVMV